MLSHNVVGKMRKAPLNALSMPFLLCLLLLGDTLSTAAKQDMAQ